MRVVLLLVTCYLLSIQIVDSRKYRLMPDDELYPYKIDKSVPLVTEYFSIENFTFEQIDDDYVEIGGFPICIKSFDPKLLLSFDIQTQYFERASWRDGAVRLFVPDFCAEVVNPTRMWYNITKLWTNCPPKEGDKWLIETQLLNVQILFPPTFPTGLWRAYFLFTQGLMGSVNKFGLMIQTELIEIA